MIRVLFFCFLATPAISADFEFCWIGANDYTLEGRMTVADAAMSKAIITQTDVTAFGISGYHKGIPLGTWSLSDRTPATRWTLNFDPATLTFATGGLSFKSRGQEWNAGGTVTDCGDPGFGFNAGSFSQDLCVNNTYRPDSAIDPKMPLRAYPLGEGPACGAPALLGGLLIPHEHG